MKDSIETKEQKSNATESTEASRSSAKKQKEETVSFSSWFTMKCSEKRAVQPHHYETLSAFFNKQGLQENEAASDYDAALKIFGY